MKTRNFFRNTALVLLAGFTVVSCNDYEEELDVITDVYVINKMFDNEVKSAAAYFAYGNKELMSVSVVFPNSAGNVALESYPGSIYTMAKEPKDAAYKTTAPAIGDYSEFKNQLLQGLNGRSGFGISEAIKEAANIEDKRYKFF